MLASQLHQYLCAEHIIGDSIGQVLLHKPYVLVSRCMEHDLRLVAAKDLMHPIPVADVSNHCMNDKRFVDKAIMALQFGRNMKNGILTMAKEHNFLRSKGSNLPAQFTADGTAGSCYHHACTADKFRDIERVNVDCAAAEKVFNFDVTKLSNRRS